MSRQVSVKNKNGTLAFRIFLFLFIGGYIFFFSSKLWMPTAGDAKRVTRIGQEMDWNDRKVKILRWDYSPEQSLMEVELSIVNKKFDGINTYDYTALKPDGSSLAVNVVLEEPDWVILQIEDVPKKFSELALRMEFPDNEDAGMIKMYTNKNDVRMVDKIKAKDRNGYLKARYEEEISGYNESISDLQQQIQKEQEEIENIKEEITRLDSNREYQTESENEQTDSLVLEAEHNITSLNDTIDSQGQELEEYRERIQKIKEKIETIGN